MFAIVVDGGRQYRVQPGDQLLVDYRDGTKPGEALKFEEVLLAGAKSGPQIGKPSLAGASVAAEVVEHTIGDKLEIGKFKRRKKERRHTGHRQKYTAIKITGFDIPGLKDE
ncbi:MAG: 50S ribosomal protein L21 [Planctomycetales bacterium]